MLLLKLIRKFFKILNADAAPWQVFLGACLGILIGLLPIWPLTEGPSPLGLIVVALALFVNCHLGSVLIFMAIGALLFIALRPLADNLAPNLEGLASVCAENWFLHQSLLSHTGWLAITVFALIIGPLCGFAMAWLAQRFQKVWKPKIIHRRRLISTGKTATNPWLLRLVGWFFGV